MPKEDFDANEWGNIQLNGVSDEKLWSTNWNRIKDKKHLAIVGKKISKTKRSNPEKYKHTEETKMKISKEGKKWHKDPVVKQRYLEGIKNRNLHTPAVFEAAKKAGILKRKTIIHPKGKHTRIGEVAKLYGIAVGSLQTRMKNWPHLFYYEDEGPGKPTKKEYFYTPLGRFTSMRQAYCKHTKQTYNNKLKNFIRPWWDEVSSENPKKYFTRFDIIKWEDLEVKQDA